jgi:TPR repeat protein
MNKRIAVLVLALGCGMASADELSDGIKAWEQQDYVQAHRIFNKLAAAGNAEAQRQLGEMIGFGEGVPEDLAGARSWLERSRAAGNKDAAASLALVERRASHKAEVQRYLSAYDGSELALSNYHCAKPTLPEVSTTKKAIAAGHAQVSNWYECYGRFAKNLSAALAAPSGGIPVQTAEIMNTAELARARVRTGEVLAHVAAEGKAEADAIAAAERNWLAVTEQTVKANDEMARQIVAEDRRMADRIIQQNELQAAVVRSQVKR